MAAEEETKSGVLAGRLSRRGVIGGTLAAASVAVAYAALGDHFDSLPVLEDNSRDLEAAALDHESVRISHLLRRAGFGASRAEHDHYQSIGLDATIDELVNYTSINDDEALQLANSQFPIDADARATLPAWWLVRMANSRRPLQEKMVLFWHGLLTTQVSEVRDPVAMQQQNELFRARALGPFPELLRVISQDPAMMLYLDIAGSSRQAPNENYARELMELFSLGVGNYSEQDVREAARAFTGWTVPRTRVDGNSVTLGQPVFRMQPFDNGAKTFLGRTGNFRGEDIVDIIVQQPAASQYIVRRLFAFFVHPEPQDADLKPFVDVYDRNNRSVGAVVEAMLRSDVFYSPKAYRSLIKSPIEYAVSAIKALGMQTTAGQAVGNVVGGRNDNNAFSTMGQIPFEPPNVAGWPGGASWLNSATMFARLNFVNRLTGGAPPNNPNQRPPAPAQAPGANLGSAEAALAYYLPLVLDDNLPAESRQVLIDYAGGPANPLSPEQLRGLVYLILASPQFHLA